MNSDIIYEILRYLYICPEENGGALLARKIVICAKYTQVIQTDALEKPIVYKVMKTFSDLDDDILENLGTETVYFEDSSSYTIKIFGPRKYCILPNNILDVYSIGNLTNLSRLFTENIDISFRVCDKWDTSKVTSVSHMFHQCREFNHSVGRNWNTSNVDNMSGMLSAM